MVNFIVLLSTTLSYMWTISYCEDKQFIRLYLLVSILLYVDSNQSCWIMLLLIFINNINFDCVIKDNVIKVNHIT